MADWREELNFDPIIPLLNNGNVAVEYFSRRDLLNEKVKVIDHIWQLPEVNKILKKQQPDGSWRSKSQNRLKHPAVKHDLIETWKQFRFLVDQYEMNRDHSSIQKAAEYIFSCQTEEGDIRGILGHQYAAYYTGALLSLLIKSGYGADPRTEKGLQWLLSVRQIDGGWLSGVMMTKDISWKEVIRLTSQEVETVPYTKDSLSKPSSHNWTGMVIRAFSAHPEHRKSPDVKQAAELLKERFFQKDPHYTSYQDAGYWVRFQFPFWWNNLIAALDSLSTIGLSSEDKDIRKALNWIRNHQQEDGLWKVSYWEKYPPKNTLKEQEMQLWISLAICRILSRFFS